MYDDDDDDEAAAVTLRLFVKMSDDVREYRFDVSHPRLLRSTLLRLECLCGLLVERHISSHLGTITLTT